MKLYFYKIAYMNEQEGNSISGLPYEFSYFHHCCVPWTMSAARFINEKDKSLSITHDEEINVLYN